MAQAGEHLVPAILGTSPRHGADCFQHRLGQGLTASLTPVWLTENALSEVQILVPPHR
jgi:hypothetical protein